MRDSEEKEPRGGRSNTVLAHARFADDSILAPGAVASSAAETEGILKSHLSGDCTFEIWLQDNF